MTIKTPVEVYERTHEIVDAEGGGFCGFYDVADGEEIATALNERAELLAEVERLMTGLRMCYESYGVKSIEYLLPPEVIEREQQRRKEFPQALPKLDSLEAEVERIKGEIVRRDALLGAASAIHFGETSFERVPFDKTKWRHPTTCDYDCDQTHTHWDSVLLAFESLGGKDDGET